MAATKRSCVISAGRLQALSSAALALPAYGASPPAETTLDYHYFQYREADVDAAKRGGGSAARYEVDAHKLTATAALGERYALATDITLESMSGASPWYITPNGSNPPLQVMSGASIKDDREDISVVLTRYDVERSLSFSLGHSNEDDYRANYFGLQAAFEPLGRLFSWGLGLSYSDDHLEPTQGGSTQYPNRIVEADKEQWLVQAHASQILNASSVVLYGVSFGRNSGFLSDPYKLVFVEDSALAADTRPDERSVTAWFLRWRKHFKKFSAALHLDYRGTSDDWDVQTQTLEAQWVHRLSKRWRLSSGLRYYSQSQAEFYSPFFAGVPGDGYMSSDYRLSPYGALSFLAQLNLSVASLELGLGFETYDASADLALGSVAVENPGLLEYQLINLRVAYHFE